MIRLDRVELLHWDIQPHQVLPLARGVTVLTGENGSGKTSVLDAIKVALGAELTGDRSVNSYLLKQAAPVAMIRLLVDNRPEPGSRRRPFDPLGDPCQDLVTLAVVFRAVDEGTYNTDYYLLDGDVVPLDGTRKYRAQPTRQDFRDRLKKVGIGRQYLRLLTLPQGQIASFCRKNGAALFDDLYDIIGGRQALETWTQRLLELREAEQSVKLTATDLQKAEGELKRLDERVVRHREYLDRRHRRDAYQRALPWVRVGASREEVARLTRELAQATGARERALAESGVSAGEVARLNEKIQSIDGALRDVEQRLLDLGGERDKAVTRRADAGARLQELERLRQAAEGVPVLDLARLREEEERVRAALAGGRSQAEARRAERATLQEQMDRVAKGIVPYPPAVEAFRATLRAVGIVHHLLAEVVEVRDSRWRPAIEGFLGRHRLAVLVQDPSSWPEAARLAREARYAHGVLAPDVKGSSLADPGGLLSLLDIHEPRYRPLVARLVRHVLGTEPSEPFSPVRAGEILAADGFVLSRIEARSASADRAYLGRAALEQRRAELTEALRLNDDQVRAWAEQERGLRAEIATLQAEITGQERRQQWEACAAEHAEVKLDLARAQGEVLQAETTRGAAEAQLQGLRKERDPLAGRKGSAAERRTRAEADADAQQRTIEALVPQLAAAETTLGSLQVDVEGVPDDAIRTVLAEVLPVHAMESAIRQLDADVARYPAEERDTLLPVNAERQRGEVAAVRERLDRLDTGLGQTRAAAEAAQEQYHTTTRRVFRSYFAKLKEAAAQLDLHVEGTLDLREDGKFTCDIRVRVGEKGAVHHDSEDLSGGQKAALSILMGMTAVSLESDGAGFFLIDEPFSASDVHKVNELGAFLGRTDAQYLLSMPTSSDLERCGEWLEAVWICTKSRGGMDEQGKVRLAPPVKLGVRAGAMDGA